MKHSMEVFCFFIIFCKPENFYSYARRKWNVARKLFYAYTDLPFLTAFPILWLIEPQKKGKKKIFAVVLEFFGLKTKIH